MSQSTTSRMIVADNAAISSNAVYVAFRENSLVSQRIFGRNDGHRGTRQQAACRARLLSDKCGGSISGYFSNTEIDFFLLRGLGSADSSTLQTFPAVPLETVAPWYAVVDKVAAKYLYNKLRISSWELSGQETQYLNWNFNCVGELETVWSTSFPASPATPECGTSYTFSDVVFTYASTVYPLQSFRLSMNNAVDDQQYENSITPSRFEATDCQITLDVQCAFRSDTLALYKDAITGGTASLVVADGTTTYTFAFANLKIPGSGPTIPATGRINMPLSMMAYRSNSTGVAATDNQLRVSKA